MALRIQERGEVVKGVPVVEPGDDLFWFNRPRLILYLINFVLFQNAFQLAFFAWTWVISFYYFLFSLYIFSIYFSLFSYIFFFNFTERIWDEILFPWAHRGFGDQNNNGVTLLTTQHLLYTKKKKKKDFFLLWLEVIVQLRLHQSISLDREEDLRYHFRMYCLSLILYFHWSNFIIYNFNKS